jgi:hypothetical protein
MGDETTYSPADHLPKSIVRQRSLQKGNSGSEAFTGCRQMGHRNRIDFLRGINKWNDRFGQLNEK